MGISAFPPAQSSPGIPSGATASRPASPVIGDTFYNGTESILEIYDGTNWIPCSAPPSQPSIVVTDIGTSRAFGQARAQVVFTDGLIGGPIYGYTAITASTSATVLASVTSTVFLDFGSDGTKDFTGTSYNAFGTSVSTPASSIAVTTVPSTPTSLTATPAATSISLSWTASTSGGKSISHYNVVRYDAGIAQAAVTSSASTNGINITGLSTSTAYGFRVSAVNANGEGDYAAVTSGTTVSVEYLVIAGGGGGGSVSGGHESGGGGAGGYRTNRSGQTSGRGSATESSFTANPGTSYTVTVGAGGAASTVGNNSVFSTVTSSGGGRGGNGGGSGGGGAGGAGGGGAHNNGTAGAGTANQGYDGGSAASSTGGGGGGAGAAGGSNTGVGGAGLSNNITGSSVTRGGGGAGYNGGSGQGISGGGGGFGGGGGERPGTANTGGGGGTGNAVAGSAGGSGVVILRYPSAATITIGAGLTGSTATDGSDNVTTFTAGTGSVNW